MMDAKDTAALRALAIAAQTKLGHCGPWMAEPSGYEDADGNALHYLCTTEPNHQRNGFAGPYNSASLLDDHGWHGASYGFAHPEVGPYIAAFNPATALALLDENAALRAALAQNERMAGWGLNVAKALGGEDHKDWKLFRDMCGAALESARALLTPKEDTDA